MEVIGAFLVDVAVYRWQLEEEPPVDAIGAGATPFGGVVRISTTSFRGSDIDEEEIAVLALSRTHFQNLDDYRATVRKVSTALRYSFPLRFVGEASISKVAKSVVEDVYSRYDVRPELLTGENGQKLVVNLDVSVFIREEEEEGEMASLPPVENSGEEDSSESYDFEKLSVPWRLEDDFLFNLRRCFNLPGFGETDEIWEVEPYLWGGGAAHFEDDEEWWRCDTPEP